MDSHIVVKLRANVCSCKNGQTTRGSTDGRTYDFFCLSHDNVLDKKFVKMLQLSFFILITLGKFNALASWTTDEWMVSRTVVKLRANVCWRKKDRQRVDADGQICFVTRLHS